MTAGIEIVNFDRLDSLSEQQVDALRLALAMLGSRSQWAEVKQVQWLNVSRIVAVAWDLGRLEDCRARLKVGEKPPAINVSRYRVGKRTFYILNDGNHRTIAAREVGQQKIKAEVEGEFSVEVEQFRLEGNQLWMQVPGQSGTQVRVSARSLEPQVWCVLLGLGVRQ